MSTKYVPLEYGISAFFSFPSESTEIIFSIFLSVNLNFCVFKFLPIPLDNSQERGNAFISKDEFVDALKSTPATFINNFEENKYDSPISPKVISYTFALSLPINLSFTVIS